MSYARGDWMCFDACKCENVFVFARNFHMGIWLPIWVLVRCSVMAGEGVFSPVANAERTPPNGKTNAPANGGEGL